MIIPSIDLVGGRAVQLIGGEAEAIDAGDPVPILRRFSIAGEVAVIDIEAARGEGTNEAIIRDLCRRAPIRVGGGIRDAQTALAWLDAGASKVIIGTAATPELLSQLPADRVIVALDSRDGRVVTHGWRTSTADSVLTRIAELKDLVGGFLVTFVELEGRMGGTDLDRALDVVTAAGEARVTIAGGITTTDEIAEIDRLGADAQVGMALYSGEFSLADAIAAPLTSERPDGLWPTVVVDESGAALGLTWSSAESLDHAVEQQRGIYRSVGEGSDLGCDTGSPGNRRRLRPRRPAFHGPSAWQRLLPPGYPLLLGRRRWHRPALPPPRTVGPRTGAGVEHRPTAERRRSSGSEAP